jgi:hypothetical protein
MAKRSQQAQTQIDNAKAVVASVETHAEDIAARAAEALGSLSAESIRETMRGAARGLSSITEALEGAEDAYVAEQADDVPARAARDEAAATLLPLAVHARARVADAFGADALEQYGLDGPTPRAPKALATHITSAIKLMREQAREGADPLGVAVSTAAIAEALDAPLAALNEALSATLLEEREKEAALTARDRASERHGRAYRGVASLLAGLYAIADRDDLAERIRPTVRREAGLEPTPPEAAAAEPSAENEESAESAESAGAGEPEEASSAPASEPSS